MSDLHSTNSLSVLNVENVVRFVDADNSVGRVDQKAPRPSSELDALHGSRARCLHTNSELRNNLKI